MTPDEASQTMCHRTYSHRTGTFTMCCLGPSCAAWRLKPQKLKKGAPTNDGYCGYAGEKGAA